MPLFTWLTKYNVVGSNTAVVTLTIYFSIAPATPQASKRRHASYTEIIEERQACGFKCIHFFHCPEGGCVENQTKA